MERFITTLSSTELGVLGCVSLALALACSICGLLAYMSNKFTKDTKSAAAIFMITMAFVFLELTVTASAEPIIGQLIPWIITAEIVVLTAFAVISGIYALSPVILVAATLFGITDNDSEDDDEEIFPDFMCTRTGHAMQRFERVYYILPDMTDEEIEIQLTNRNSE